MPRAHGLGGLALPAVGRAPQLPIIARTDCITRRPELRGDSAVAAILQHSRLAPAADFPTDFGGELELIAPVVNGPRMVGFHEDSVVGIGDQIFQPPYARQQADI